MPLEFPFSEDELVGDMLSSGIKFDAYLDCCKKSPGRFRLCFHAPEIHQKGWNDPLGNYFPRVSFRTHEKSVMLLGMLLPDELKGKNLSLDFVIALNRLSSVIGGELLSTAKIRKPILARKLQDWGFQPEERSGEAELLPHSKYGEKIPHVCFSDPKQSEDVPFYRAIDKKDLPNFPRTNRERATIFLNTNFRKTAEFDGLTCDFNVNSRVRDLLAL